MNTLSYCIKELFYKKRFFKYIIVMWVIAVLIPFSQFVEARESTFAGTITSSFFLIHADRTLFTLFVTTIPLVTAMIYGGIYIEEQKFMPNLLMRTKSWKLHVCHILIAFLSSFMLYLFFQLLCYLMTSIMLNTDSNMTNANLYVVNRSAIETNSRNISLYDLYLNHPELRIFVYILLDSLYAGVCGILSYTMSLFTKRKLIAYIAPFCITALILLVSGALHSSISFQGLVDPSIINNGNPIVPFLILSACCIFICALICVIYQYWKERR